MEWMAVGFGRMDGMKNEWMNTGDRLMFGQMNGWNECMDERNDGWIGWMNG